MAAEIIGGITPYSTGTTFLTVDHTLTFTPDSGNLEAADLMVIFKASWFSADSTPMLTQMVGWNVIDEHFDTPSWGNDALVYSGMAWRYVTAQDVLDSPTSYDAVFEYNGSNFKGALFGCIIRGSTATFDEHGPTFYQESNGNQTDVPAKEYIYDPDMGAGYTSGLTNIVGVPLHDLAPVGDTDGIVFVLAGALGRATHSNVDGTFPAGLTLLDENYDTYNTSGTFRSAYFGWGYEILSGTTAEPAREVSMVATGSGAIGVAAVDRYAMMLAVEHIDVTDLLSTVATIDHDLIIGVEPDQHHAEVHTLYDEAVHEGGLVYKTGVSPVITDTDITAVGITAAANGQMAVTYDTDTGITLLWTRVNSTWTAIEASP